MISLDRKMVFDILYNVYNFCFLLRGKQDQFLLASLDWLVGWVLWV